MISQRKGKVMLAIDIRTNRVVRIVSLDKQYTVRNPSGAHEEVPRAFIKLI